MRYSHLRRFLAKSCLFHGGLRSGANGSRKLERSSSVAISSSLIPIMASERLRLTWRCAGKSVTIEELKELQEGTRAMVVYHHQTHRKGGHLSEICHLATRLGENGLHVSGALRAKPWSPRVFFILNGDEFRNRAKSVAERWGNRISWHPDVEILKSSA